MADAAFAPVHFGTTKNVALPPHPECLGPVISVDAYTFEYLYGVNDVSAMMAEHPNGFRVRQRVLGDNGRAARTVKVVGVHTVSEPHVNGVDKSPFGDPTIFSHNVVHIREDYTLLATRYYDQALSVLMHMENRQFLNAALPFEQHVAVFPEQQRAVAFLAGPLVRKQEQQQQKRRNSYACFSTDDWISAADIDVWFAVRDLGSERCEAQHDTSSSTCPCGTTTPLFRLATLEAMCKGSTPAALPGEP